MTVFSFRAAAPVAVLLAVSLQPSIGAGVLAPAAGSSADRLEPGLQGQWQPEDKPGSILAQPYMKGVRVIGHDSILGRDSNVQLSWVDHCAYVSSTAGPFPLLGTTKGDPALTGVAVIDVSDPGHPRTVKLLRDRGSIAALETMHAVAAPGRKVLAAGAYHGGPNAAGTSGSGNDPDATAAWLDIYDVSDCANPKLMAEVKWPENSHTVRVSPDGRLVYGTNMSPFTGKGGIQVMDISDLTHPRFLGKFGATRADGSSFEFASHEVSFSADGRRMFAGVNSSLGDDLNQGIKIFPPNREALGPRGGGVYIFDNSDFVAGRPDPKLRLLGVLPAGGWHSIMPARINGVPYLVGGAELGACPGTWPKLSNIADETRPFIAGEFRLAMNRQENCPPPTPAENGSSGIVPSPGSATLHFNDVDSATDTRLGLFQFLWAGLRIADLKDPKNPVEVAYFKPGDACGGHVRYLPKTGHIWLSCGQSGFYVVELQPDLRKALGLPKVAPRSK
jgi:LVIVD repeat